MGIVLYIWGTRNTLFLGGFFTLTPVLLYGYSDLEFAILAVPTSGLGRILNSLLPYH